MKITKQKQYQPEYFIQADKIVHITKSYCKQCQKGFGKVALTTAIHVLLQNILSTMSNNMHVFQRHS